MIYFIAMLVLVVATLCYCSYRSGYDAGHILGKSEGIRVGYHQGFSSGVNAEKISDEESLSLMSEY